MKKIMSIIISVVMLFSACGNQTDNLVEESVQTQIATAEEFDGITFGMTKDEVITIIGREPDDSYENIDKDGYNIRYDSQIFLNITTYHVDYTFDENDNLDSIWAIYDYFDESEKEQMPIDLDHVKEELSKYYPENTLTRTDEKDNVLFLFTESRMICLETLDNSFIVFITIRD